MPSEIEIGNRLSSIRGALCHRSDTASPRSAECFRVFFEQAPVGICISGLDRRILYANSRFCQMLGYPAEELIGTPWTKVIHPDNLAKMLQAGKKQFEEPGKLVEFEMRFLHQSGAVAWGSVKASMVLDSGGQPLYSVTYVEDITAHKLAEEQRSESEERFRMIAESCPPLMWATDAQGNIQFFNRACRKFYGVSLEKMDRATWERLFHPDDQPALQKAYACSSEARKSFRIEVRGRREDGEWRLLGITGEPRYSLHGEYLGYIGLGADITDRIKAEQAREFELSLIRSIYEGSPDGILVVDTDGQVISLNQRFLDVWKIATPDGSKLRCENLAGGENATGGHDPSILACIVEQVNAPESYSKQMQKLSNDPAAVDHCEIELKDGRTLERHSKGLKNRDGRYLGRVWFFRDITIRKQMENAMREAEQKYRGIFDKAIVGIFQCTTDGSFLSVNPAMAFMLHYDSPEETVASITDITRQLFADPKRGIEFMLVMDRVGGVGNFECEVFRKDGSRIWISLSIRAIRQNGAVLRYEGMSQEITERKQMENALREAEQKYRGIFDCAVVGIFQATPEGRLLSANPAMAAMYGYASPSEMIASVESISRQLYVDPQKREEFLSQMENLGGVSNFECENFRKDGSKFWISLNAIAIHENGVVVRYEGTRQDITERKLLQDQLYQAQKLESVGQLAAGIAHEINTPTQYIGDNVRFLKEAFTDLSGLLISYDHMLADAKGNALSPERIQETAAAAESVDVAFLTEEIPLAIDQGLEGVARVAKIVGAMKEFSHPDTKEKVPLDLNHAIESTLTVARNEWKYVAKLETDFESSLPLISCHPGEFNQVILNIVVNAAHAIADANKKNNITEGKITVVTRNASDWVEIRIQDTGGGIPEQVQSRIFDPFFTTKEIGKGTGQGLAIARSVVVDKHHGSLHFETEVGTGTTFVIRLPHDGKAQVDKSQTDKAQAGKALADKDGIA